MNKYKIYLSLAIMLIMTACSTTSVSTGASYRSQSSSPVVIENADPLDVSIAVFNPGIPVETDGEYGSKGIYPELRRAEAMYMAVKLRDQLSDSKSFGAVRVTPDLSSNSDLYIKAKILKSNGEDVEMKVTVLDSTGKTWIREKKYKHRVTSYVFDNPRNKDEDGNLKIDPYQPIYKKINDDISSYLRKRMNASKVEAIHTTAQIRFARDFSPGAFSDILIEKRGKYTLKGRPASDDPMMKRVQNIKYRDEMFIDTMQSHYDSFYSEMKPNYSTWQKEGYVESKAAREAAARATGQMFGAILMGALTVAAASECDSQSCIRNVGAVGAAATGTLAAKSAKSRKESKIHLNQLNEMGKSLDAALSPSVIEMEDTTITLTGSANEQFSQWKEILTKIYNTETSVSKEIEVVEDI
tara:strand:- start:7067 stop:8302 length:1236 start_codon:yes stop_codon:yes gene_type:complete